MSWFTDLAGKAESLLEKVDNTAANVLQVDEKIDQSDSQIENSNQPDSDVGIHPTEYGASRISRTTSEGSLLHLGPSAPLKSRLQSSIPRQQPKPLKKEEKNDDQLFRFLNSNVSSSKEKKSGKQSPVLTRKTSEPEVSVKVDSKKSEDSLVPSKDGIDLTETSNLTSDIEGVEEPPVQSIDHKSASPLAPAVQQTADNNRASNMELENKLLRKEIKSLNEEMVSQVQRVKESEKRLQCVEQQLAKSEEQLMATESIVRQLRVAEEDFNQALAAKDSQLAVLRVRIQQVDQELQEKKSQIENFKVEREQLLQDHTDSSGVHNHALEVVQAKLEECERTLKMEKETRHNVQQEALERQSRLEEEQHAMAESMRSLQKKVSDERSKANDQAAALKIAKANLEAARQEMKDYKEKAGRILQAKDKVISTLREGREGDDLGGGGITSVEYDEVCQERDAFREELSQSRFRIEELKAELQDMEHHHQTDADIVQEKLDVMQGLLDDEKRKREACEEEIRTQTQDVRLAHEEGQRNKTSLMNQIQDREKEIQRLKNQLAAKTLTSTNEVELENRVRALTENLIQKQTVIEALSTEKNSLVLQLERLEQQYRDVQASSTKHINTTAIPLDSTDDSDENTLTRVKSITSVMPMKLNDSRQVKRAVNEIDKCSIRLGLFLKRYPVARLFVILYMFLLHVWVLVVLLTYKPEIHDTNPASMPQRPT